MRAFFAVARREFRERRFVFAAAGVAAIVPLVIPIVRQLSGDSASVARQTTAALLATILAGGLAVGLGTGVFASDSANRHLGFYFAKPLSAWTLWMGKVTGSLAIVVSCLTIVLAPTLLVDGGFSPLRDLAGSTSRGLGIELFFLILLFLVAHAAATIVRSRSPLVAADLVAAAIVVLGGSLVASWLVPLDLPRSRWIPAALCVAAAAIFIAGLRALSRGRTDRVRTHGAFSATLWSIGLLSTIAFAVYATWVLGARPSALAEISAIPVGPNGWVLIVGRARGAWARFLYDTKSGGFRRVVGFPISSSDGSVALWADTDKLSGHWTIRLQRLDQPGSVPIDTGLTTSPSAIDRLFLSADGRRAGMIEHGILSVIELPSGQSAGSAKVADESHDETRGFFLGSRVVRVLRSGRTPVSKLEILEFDTATRTLSKIGSVEAFRNLWSTVISSSGDRFVARDGEPARLTLRDGRSGALLAVLREGPDISGTAIFLGDGRLATSRHTKTGGVFTVFSRAGLRQGEIEISGGMYVRTGAEVAPGQLTFGWIPALSPRAPGETVLEIADLDRLTTRPVAENLRPLPIWWSRFVPPPGSEATKLFIDSKRGLVRFDPGTGERRTIVGPG